MISRTIFFLAALIGGMTVASAQSKTLAASIGVQVFPADGQDSAEQSRDEASCYEWAVDNTGADPFELSSRAASQEAAAERAAQQARTAGQGRAAGGAVSGAVTGAVIGNVFGSSSRSRRNATAAGALIGISAGAASRQAEQAQAASSAQRAAGRAEATQQQIATFHKAFSACLEANDYIAKY